ncbi:MAG: stage V sporulation protein AD [Clostridiales bacterium]|nr:MAG: stage V sporulation protein AD [Clostridiales bacterium]
MAVKQGKYAFRFEKEIYIVGYGNVAGAKEQKGPLGNLFDKIEPDLYCGKKTMEQAEVCLQQTALENALKRAGIEREELDLVGAGDLLNQCISSAYSFRDSNVPYIGLYGACSTMALSTLISAMSIEAGLSQHAAAFTSSHFGTAERQYRFPLEYGGQRTPSAQHTVTASGAVVLSQKKGKIRLDGGAFGAILDKGVTDVNNMGGAMAPAALRLILDYLRETQTRPEDYDLILTGDLGYIGASVVVELAKESGVNLQANYQDCGLLIYDREKQDMHAGGSGCGCSAAVLTAYVLPKLERGELKNVLFLSTGALMSPLSVMQGESIPAIAHLIHLKGENA